MEINPAKVCRPPHRPPKYSIPYAYDLIMSKTYIILQEKFIKEGCIDNYVILMLINEKNKTSKTKLVLMFLKILQS